MTNLCSLYEYMNTDISKKQPCDVALVSLLSAALLCWQQSVGGITDPWNKLGHLCVDTIFAFACTALSPAHNTGDKVGVMVARDVRPATVALAGILGYCVIASAEHALCDAQLSGFHASVSVHVGYREALQEGGSLTSLAKTSKTADHTVWLAHQDLQHQARKITQLKITSLDFIIFKLFALRSLVYKLCPI